MLKSRWRLLVVVAFMVTVVLPGLMMGLFMDDYMLLLILEKQLPWGSPLDLFNFGDGNPEAALRNINMGPFPWFTLPEIRVHFFRPLTCATMALDRLVFGRNIVLYHAHSFAWYLGMLGAAWLLYRRALPGALGTLALLLFAFDEAHWFPAVWWANRNAMVSALPALLGLLAHMRWREEGWKPGLPLSMTGYALGLAGGETALGVFGYLAAYECWRGGKLKLRAAALGLLPAAMMGAAYLVVYKLGNYGAYGSDIYIDPAGDPAGFLARLAPRIIVLAAAHFFSIPAELPVVVQGSWPALLAVSIAAVGVAALGLRAAWGALSAAERHAMRWLLVGAVLSALPVCATFPSGRLLLVPSLGGAAAIAVLIRAGWRALEVARWRRVLAYALVGVHFVFAPSAWMAQSLLLGRVAEQTLQASATLDIAPNADGADQEVIVLNAGNPVFAFYPMLYRTYLELPNPRHMHTITFAPFDIRLTRTDPKTIELDVIDGQLMTTLFERLLRDKRHLLKPGDSVTMDVMRVTVLASGTHGPTRLAVTFHHPLDDPRYAFLTWKDGGLRRIALPAQGQSILLPHKNNPFL